jgi:hypothetical protein
MFLSSDGEANLSRYTDLLSTIAAGVVSKYGPDWRMRVYHNVTEAHPVRNVFCGLYCDHGHVDFCDVSLLPDIEGEGSVADVRRRSKSFKNKLVL